MTGDQELADSIPAGSGDILLWRLVMKYIVFSTVILFLSLIQEEQLSVCGERMLTSTG